MLYMILDCESVGLHGETFAAGWVVVDEAGKELGFGMFACHPDDADGDDDGRQWVGEFVPGDIFPDPGAFSPAAVRDEFWAAWEHWKAKGAVLAADCAWPVEARFLSRCVDQDKGNRCWGGPYPLHDVASVRLARGFDPLATAARLPNELPAHNPLADARQSARLLIEALNSTASSTQEALLQRDPGGDIKL